VFNGVDDRPGWSAPGGGRGGGRLTVGVVSRLSWEKGVDRFVEALALVDPAVDVHAVVVGDGDQRADLRRRAEALGLGRRVEFRSASVGVDLADLDLVVVPSRTEGFGLVAAEAGAAARPVLASRVGGLLDVVRDGENGWLVPVGDAWAMARAIEAASDPALRRRMGLEGRQRFESQFRVELMVEQTLAVYRSALAGRRFVTERIGAPRSQPQP
jgi:glycosyltransferase involved in cell wall biosynthesis